MFERYTEKARRIIFFARYEASQYGSPYIETEHMLLGLLREDKALTFRFLKIGEPESIRKEIEARTEQGKKIPVSVDLPLSNECKRVLAYGAEEAERLSDKHIGPEHLLLGLLREEKSFAAQILVGRGLRLTTVREELKRQSHQDPGQRAQASPTHLSVFGGDLTVRAAEGQLYPVVGREKQISTLIQVLGRSTRKNAVLVGEAGVGKTSIVEGLAQRIAEGRIPVFLSERTIRELDVSQFAGIEQTRAEEYVKRARQELHSAAGAVLFMQEFYPLLAATPPAGVSEMNELLKTALLTGAMQCICTATPDDFSEATAKHRWLNRCFRAIEVQPMTEEEALQVLVSARPRYEQFHSMTFADDVLSHVVRYASAYIKDRYLPDKALDLLDEAAAYAKARALQEPPEITEIRKRLRFISAHMENAIANHEFEKARFYSDEERKARDLLREGLRKHNLGEGGANTLTAGDVEEVLAQWLRVSVDSIRSKKVGNKPDTGEPLSQA
jgi:ATP-dependent Clp protease ATP-binding subunit ClpC